jgi:hypothetical protein
MENCLKEEEVDVLKQLHTIDERMQLRQSAKAE